MYAKRFKAIFDCIFAFLVLTIIFPFLIIIAFILYLKEGPPIYFKQVRPGLEGRPFIIYKFRTMKRLYNKHGVLCSDSERLTSFGNLLRRFSIDELPELFNVLKGEMSIVGPRPLLMIYVPLFSNEQKKRMCVKPGITGWAQVNGRNGLSWEEKFVCDLWYINHLNLKLDIRILFLTIIQVFKCEGISAKDHVTMPGFEGSMKNDFASLNRKGNISCL